MSAFLLFIKKRIPGKYKRLINIPLHKTNLNKNLYRLYNQESITILYSSPVFQTSNYILKFPAICYPGQHVLYSLAPIYNNSKYQNKTVCRSISCNFFCNLIPFLVIIFCNLSHISLRLLFLFALQHEPYISNKRSSQGCPYSGYQNSIPVWHSPEIA